MNNTEINLSFSGAGSFYGLPALQINTFGCYIVKGSGNPPPFYQLLENEVEQPSNNRCALLREKHFRRTTCLGIDIHISYLIPVPQINTREPTLFF